MLNVQARNDARYVQQIAGEVKKLAQAINRYMAGGDNVLTNGQVLLVDASAAAKEIELPTASSFNEQAFTCKKIDGTANAVTITGGTIDGGANYALTSQYEYVTLVSDGENWWVIG